MTTFTIILTFILASVSVFFLNLSYSGSEKCLRSKSKTKIQVRGNIFKEHTTTNINPVTRVSIVKIALWLTFCGGQRLTNLYMYFNRLNKMVEVPFLGKKYLLISDYKTSKEALKNPLVCGRPKIKIFDFYSQGCLGIIMNYGKEGQEHRKFCLSNFKTFGIGTKSTEAFIQNEVEELCEIWLREEGKRFSPNEHFFLPMVNSLWLILTGEKASKETSKWIIQYYKDIKSIFTHFNNAVSCANVQLSTLVRIHKFFPIFGAFKNMAESIVYLRVYFQQLIDSRKKILFPSVYSTDLVDAYLNVILKQKQNENETNFSSKINEKHLHTVMYDILFAGGDTAGTTLAWAMLHLVRNPEMQEKICKELDSVVGRDRNPSLNDRPMCPYTEAFIYEVLRFSPVAPFGVPHATLDDTVIASHRVKKGTVVSINIYGIHHDPTIWGDPENFRPERFLSEDRNSFVGSEAMCIFSSGPRKCIGEQIAKDSLFLFISTICKRFLLKQDPLLGDFPPLLDSNATLHSPQNFYMTVQDRLAQ